MAPNDDSSSSLESSLKLIQKKLRKCETLIETATSPEEKQKWEKKRLEYEHQLLNNSYHSLGTPKSARSSTSSKQVLSPSFAKELLSPANLDGDDCDSSTPSKKIKGRISIVKDTPAVVPETPKSARSSTSSKEVLSPSLAKTLSAYLAVDDSDDDKEEQQEPKKIKGRISIVKDVPETPKSATRSSTASKEVMSPSFAKDLLLGGGPDLDDEDKVQDKSPKKKIKGRISIDKSQKEPKDPKLQKKMTKVNLLLTELFERFEGTLVEFYESKDYKRLQKKQIEYARKLGVDAPKFKPRAQLQEPQSPAKRSSLALFRAKARKIIMLRRIFAGRDYDQLSKGEQRADQKSLRRSSLSKRSIQQPTTRTSCLKNPEDNDNDDGVVQQRTIQWKQAPDGNEFVVIYWVEDLTRRDTTWGNIWEDLYWSEDEMAEMKYEAFMEQCGFGDDDVGDPWAD